MSQTHLLKKETQRLRESAQAAHVLTARPKTKRRTDRPRFTYRIDPPIHEHMHTIKAAYATAGYKTSIDQIAEDLIAHALQQWEQGQVEITVTPIEPEPRLIGRPSQEE